jgi:hypothetical protein
MSNEFAIKKQRMILNLSIGSIKMDYFQLLKREFVDKKTSYNVQMKYFTKFC